MALLSAQINWAPRANDLFENLCLKNEYNEHGDGCQVIAPPQVALELSVVINVGFSSSGIHSLKPSGGFLRSCFLDINFAWGYNAVPHVPR
jgi:hypothetical protein